MLVTSVHRLNVFHQQYSRHILNVSFYWTDLLVIVQSTVRAQWEGCNRLDWELRSLASVDLYRWCTKWLDAASYSSYAPYFVSPVFKRDQQNEMFELEEAQKLAHVPIKAAKNDDTSSVFHDELTRKFTNYIMKGGQKALARGLLEKAFENIKRIQIERYCKASEADKEKIEMNPQKILHEAIENSRPLLELTPIKRGGTRYQVPVPVTDKKSYFLAMKWLLTAAREKERTVHLPEKLAWELLDAAANQGRVIKKKQDLHRQCEANRAYAHYRWS